jgi:hypothetical protein
LDFNLSRYKVTPSQATLENIEPTSADIAEINVIPLIGIHDPVVTLSDDEEPNICQLASQTSAGGKKTEND